MSAKDCFALVTGTSSGIGAAVVRTLLGDGWTVTGLSRRGADFGSARYRHLEADLSDLAALRDLAGRELAPALSDARWRRVGLVNNAAVTGPDGAFDEDPERLARVFALNSVAPMFLMGLVVRKAPAAARLRIVNVSTGAAVRAFPGAGAYGSSKTALRMAGMILAVELQSEERPGGPRPDTAILSYEPGVVDTPMQESARTPGRPWNRMFVELHASGQLQPPEAPAAEIVEFLEGDGGEPFTERRLGAG